LHLQKKIQKHVTKVQQQKNNHMCQNTIRGQSVTKEITTKAGRNSRQFKSRLPKSKNRENQREQQRSTLTSCGVEHQNGQPDKEQF
jgi:hypothetical protein